MSNKIKVGLVGFGLSGKIFHAPFIDAHPDFDLRKVVERKHYNSQKKYPYVSVVRDISDLFNDKEIDIIVISTPNTLHFEMAKNSLLAGKNVVIEKPFTPTFIEAEQLISLANKKNLKLFVYQNRRWDGDFLTIKKLIKNKSIGELYEYEAHFDRFAPKLKENTWRDENIPGSGILFDLGSHLIDQAISLFGLPEYIEADIQAQRNGSKVDDYFRLNLKYKKLKVILTAGMLVKEIGPRFILKGEKGEFIKYGIDPQEEALKNGLVPTGTEWGKELQNYYGILKINNDEKITENRIKTIAGNYQGFYENVFDVLKKGKEMAVKPEDAAATIKIIEKAFESNSKYQSLKI